MCENASSSISSTPLEIAAKEDSGEMLNILGEFIKIADSVKIEKLSGLMYLRDEYEEEAKEQFRVLLSSLPLDLVREIHECVKFELDSGEHSGCARVRNDPSGSCCLFGKARLCSDLVGFRVCQLF